LESRHETSPAIGFKFALFSRIATPKTQPNGLGSLFFLLAPRQGLSMLGGLVHFELLPLAEIVLFLVFVLLFVKGSIGFVGHRKEGLRGGWFIGIM
jgi:hypothetical protein